MKKTVTCITCPLGCDIVVTGEGETIVSIEGAACKRGVEYAKNEYANPLRILASLVKVEGAGVPLVPVRSKRPIPKDRIFDIMEKVRAVTLAAPVHADQVVITDVCGTGVDIVATADAV